MPASVPGVWSLPSPGQFLDEIEGTVWDGGAVLALDASTPSGLSARLSQRFQDRFRVDRIDPKPGVLPVSLLADAVGCDSRIEAVAGAEEQVLIVEGENLPVGEQAPWATFLQRFAKARAQTADGLAILFLAPAGFAVEGMARLDWSGRLKRIDALIWAEFHVPSGRSGLFQDIAVNLAAELCGWRLDLIADLVTQREEDILSPIGWLQRNADMACGFEAAFGTRGFACPLYLFATGNRKEIDQRIWRAQLASLFPWIEERRLRIIDRYRKLLRVDDHLRKLHVTEVENIELGALKYQLRQHITRTELEHVEVLAAMRNDLAHRKPVDSQSFDRALKISDTLR